MAYTAKINGQTYFNTDADVDDYTLTSADVSLVAGASGSFTFTVPPCNIFYGEFHKLTDYVDVYRDSELIFSGRVYGIEQKFDTQHKITCEGLMAIFNDTVFNPIKHEGYLHPLISKIVADHNSQVEDAKKINVGVLRISNDPCYRDYQTYESTLSRLEDLVDHYGGFMAIRKESNGLYLDWHKTFDASTNQTIDFGENILDITISDDADSICTVLIPFGASSEDGKSNLMLGEYPDDRVYASQELINKHGYIVKTNTWEDVTIVSNLRRKAEEYITASCEPIISISISAVDLADAGYDYDAFRVGQSIKVRSKPHEIDGFYNCAEQNLNLLNPASNTLILGSVKAGFIASSRKTSDNTTNIINTIIKNYQTASDLDNAIQDASDLITGNSGGYVIIRDSDADGHPDEILIMDTDSIETAQNVWRFNQNGLAHSSTGINGTYDDAAITKYGQINGQSIATGSLLADQITAGTLRGQQGDTYWDLTHGIFHLGTDINTDKSKVFSETPTTPYFVGDLYVTGRVTTTAVAGLAIAGQAVVDTLGTYGLGGDILICTNSRASGEYNPEDWAIVTNYIDDSEVESIKGRLATAEVDIATNANGLSSKVSLSDYNGHTVASLINQSSTEIYIQAEHINMVGNIKLNDIIKFDDESAYTDRLTIKAMTPSTYTYKAADVTRVQNIIMGSVYPTSADYAKYDLDNSGHITTVDYIRIKKCVEDFGGVYNSTILIEPNEIKETIKVYNNIGNATSIGGGVVSTNYLNVSGGMYDGNGEPLGYVSEYGTTTKNGTSWSYRKWHNGFYECWASIKKTNLAMTSSWGAVYYGTIGSYVFPKTFKSTPNLQASINFSGTYGWILSAKNTTATTTTTPTYYAVCPNSVTQDAGLTIFASGYID